MDLVQKRKQLRQRQVEKVKKFRQSNMSASAAVEKQRESDAAEKQKESAAKQKQREREDIKKEVRKEIEQETQKESMDIENSDGTVFARVVDIIGPTNMKPTISNGVWKGTDQIEEGSLHKWFKGSKSKDGKGGWVNVVTGGTCASDEPGEGTPKCVSSSKRASMSKSERLSAARRKKKADPGQQSKTGAAKPTYVSTDSPRKKKMKEQTQLSNWRLDLEEKKAQKCWPGYEKKGTKKMFGKTYNNCVKKEEVQLKKTEVLDERLGGKGYKPYTSLTGKKVSGDWEDSDRGAGNKAKKRAGGKVEKKSPTYLAHVHNKEEVEYATEAKVDAGKSPEQKEKDRNVRKFGVSHNVAGHGKLRRALHRSDRGDKKIKGDKSAYVEMESVINETKDKKGKGSGTKDACYHKVKSRYSVWPSAYASGALVKCRKVGAANWGNSTKKEAYSDWRAELNLTEDDMKGMSVKSGHKRPTKSGAGMTQKGVEAYRRKNPGSKLKTAVTTEPSKLKKGSKDANRRKSYCARSAGQMKKFPKAAKDPDSRLRQARRRWNC